MGRENIIKTGTNSKKINTGLSLSAYNLTQKLPKSIYSFANVTYVNPISKIITYNIIEDNLGLNKTGIAKPLYPNKIILPQTGSIVPLIKGPDMGISTNVGQYDKTIYYMDPIGIHQTVDKNIIVKEVQTTPNELNVTTNNIKSANIGIANNNPKGDIIPCPDGLYGVFWNRMPFGFQYGKYVKGLKVPNHETHIHISFRTPQKAVETINLALSYGLFARENAYIESVDGAHSSASTWHKKTFTKEYKIIEGTAQVIIINKEDYRDPKSIDPQKRVGMALDVRADINESYNMTKEKFQKLESFFYRICNISNYKTNWK